MRDEPNVKLRCQNSHSSETKKGVGSYRQQDGGHGSRNPLRSCVKTYLPNDPAPKMDGAKVCITNTLPLA